MTYDNHDVVTDNEFLCWIYDRLVYRYKENESYDYMHRFKKIIDAEDKKDKELKELKYAFTQMAIIMKYREVPAEIGKIIVEKAGR